jgi:phage antirepressor YoqD-like protein
MWNENEAQQRGYTCSSPLEIDYNQVRQLENEINKPASLSAEQHKEMMKKIELQQTAKNIGVEPERLQRMRDYAIMLRKKFPYMKPERLKRKVAEYFKIELV